MRKIGFSHGCLFKILDVNTEESINVFASSGASTIEINCYRGADSGSLNRLLPYLKKFERISLHAPCSVRYGNNKETMALLKDLEDFYKESGAELVVIHPDVVDDWSVFDNFAMNFAVENMDDRKDRFRNPADFKEFFKTHPTWGLVLDLGHCNLIDKSMILAKSLIKEFKEKVVEIHLSGYEVLHDPLHRTKQIEIINYCKELSAPIIIESIFEVSDGVEGVKKEFDYVVENLK